jgi:hypothetical protein
MSGNRRQTLEGAYVAVPATARRRSLPPRPRVPVPMSLHQRWRERPRLRALHLTPRRSDGVVHAIVGRAACRCPRARFLQERSRRLCPYVRGQITPQKCGDAFRRNRFAYKPRSPSRTHASSVARSNRTTIAPMMLAPCSASSMLFASLRPGRWPGLRALTTPPRGTHLQLRDGGHPDDGSQRLTTMLTRASGGRMVALSRAARALLRFATTASGARIPPTAPRGTVWSASSQHRSLLQDHRSVVDLHTVGCELHGFSRRRVLRTTRRNEAAFTRA